VIEAILALLLVLVAQLYPIKLLPVRVSADKMSKSWEETMNRPEFATFNHRGRSLFKRKSNQK
jgi:hypothetical protein